jgi:hypothetical protein
LSSLLIDHPSSFITCRAQQIPTTLAAIKTNMKKIEKVHVNFLYTQTHNKQNDSKEKRTKEIHKKNRHPLVVRDNDGRWWVWFYNPVKQKKF